MLTSADLSLPLPGEKRKPTRVPCETPGKNNGHSSTGKVFNIKQFLLPSLSPQRKFMLTKTDSEQWRFSQEIGNSPASPLICSIYT
jgi:hypothetical protein